MVTARTLGGQASGNGVVGERLLREAEISPESARWNSLLMLAEKVVVSAEKTEEFGAAVGLPRVAEATGGRVRRGDDDEDAGGWSEAEGGGWRCLRWDSRALKVRVDTRTGSTVGDDAHCGWRLVGLPVPSPEDLTWDRLPR